MGPYLADVKGVEAKVSRLAVLFAHVDDGGGKKDFRDRDPEQKLPHGALLHLHKIRIPDAENNHEHGAFTTPSQVHQSW